MTGIADGTHRGDLTIGYGAALSDYYRLTGNGDYVGQYSINRDRDPNNPVHAFPIETSLYNREAQPLEGLRQGLGAGVMGLEGGGIVERKRSVFSLVVLESDILFI